MAEGRFVYESGGHLVHGPGNPENRHRRDREYPAPRRQSVGLFVAQGLDGVEARGMARREIAEHHADGG